MKFHCIIATVPLIAAVVADCPPRKRVDALKYIVSAFNEVDLQKSAELVAGMPLAPECEAYLYIDGLPGVEPAAFDSTTVKDFSQLVRQAFTHVEPRYSYADNNTATLDAVVTIGVLHVVQAPVYTRIVVPAVFEEETCLIKELPTYITIPTDIAGIPINAPNIPKIGGLDKLPGFRPILKALVPVIGDIFGILQQ